LIICIIHFFFFLFSLDLQFWIN